MPQEFIAWSYDIWNLKTNEMKINLWTHETNHRNCCFFFLQMLLLMPEQMLRSLYRLPLAPPFHWCVQWMQTLWPVMNGIVTASRCPIRGNIPSLSAARTWSAVTPAKPPILGDLLSFFTHCPRVYSPFIISVISVFHYLL